VLLVRRNERNRAGKNVVLSLGFLKGDSRKKEKGGPDRGEPFWVDARGNQVQKRGDMSWGAI